MEGFSGNVHDSPGGSPSPPPPPGEMMLAEYNPKKRAGRKKFKETRHPVYRGIRQRNSGKWVCETREPNKKTRIWLGTFPTAEMAARAHDVATIALRGRTACLNFADSAWRLHVPTSGDTKEIQQAALRAAEMFRPPPSNAGAEEQPAPQEAAASSSAAPGPSEEGMWMNELVGVGGSTSHYNYMDHDDFFEMPEMMMADMYNGMMLPPPGCGYVADDYIDDDADLPLWNF